CALCCAEVSHAGRVDGRLESGFDAGSHRSHFRLSILGKRSVQGAGAGRHQEGPMKLFVAGVSYRTAPVEVREQLAVTPLRLLEQTRRLQEEGELDEVVLLSTCNRVEIYGATRYG